LDKSRFDDLQVKADKQRYFGKDGLYFCGFYVSPTGQFREIGRDAKKIAESIVKNA
jgi:indole-3-pyruvate monooxygenase